MFNIIQNNNNPISKIIQPFKDAMTTDIVPEDAKMAKGPQIEIHHFSKDGGNYILVSCSLFYLHLHYVVEKRTHSQCNHVLMQQIISYFCSNNIGVSTFEIYEHNLFIIWDVIFIKGKERCYSSAHGEMA